MEVVIVKNLFSIGSRSVLFGVHCWFIHPWFVAVGWWKLYGFPRDIRLWVAFFVHDLGYALKPNLDGPEGEQHPYLGARIMHALFDRHLVIEHPTPCLPVGPTGEPLQPGDQVPLYDGVRWQLATLVTLWNPPDGHPVPGKMWVHVRSYRWHDFVLYHSRHLAKLNGAQPSKLCFADKLAITLEPWWLYLPRAYLSGEIHEFMRDSHASVASGVFTDEESAGFTSGNPIRWYKAMQAYIRRWIAEHVTGKPDEWTAKRQANGERKTW